MALEFFTRSRGASVAEQAAEWLFAFEDEPLTESRRSAFVAWLKRSPVHVEEFLAVSALHRQMGSMPALQVPLDELLEEARRTVVSLGDAEQQAQTPGRRLRHRRAWAIAATMLLVAAGTLLTLGVRNAGTQTYRSAVGEQRSIALEDGTVIMLNTASEVRVHFTPHHRTAVLVSGEAMFDVAKNPARPFDVAAGPMAVRVVGTRFNLYRQDAQTTLTVLEGKVAVQPATVPRTDIVGSDKAVQSSPPPKRQVIAGEQLIVAANGRMQEPPQVNVERATAWTARRVIFDEEPLAEVVDQFNRYNQRHLIIDDPQLSARKLSGAFKVNDMDVFIAFLKQQPDMRVIDEGGSLHLASAHRP